MIRYQRQASGTDDYPCQQVADQLRLPEGLQHKTQSKDDQDDAHLGGNSGSRCILFFLRL